MNVLDLFSGIGGFSLGLERAGMTTVAFCEIDENCHKVLRKHWPHVPIFTDVSKLTKDQLDANIDVIAGGFPCQDISLAGRGAGLEGARSGLWFEYHRLIKEIRPRYAIIENVSALRSRGLDQVLRSLAEIGYDAEWHCIPASALGAPHQRDRIWIVAHTERGGLQKRDLRNQRQDRSTLSEGTTTVTSQSSSSSTSLADADSAQREGRWLPRRTYEKYADISSAGWWETEPDVGRVAYGVPAWAHRLKQLGNAVVPQIPELIGRAIMDYENALA